MESKDLSRARRELSIFEGSVRDPEGVRHLAKALSLLSDLLSGAPDEREQNVARGLFKSYSGRAASLVGGLLKSSAELSDEELAHWFNVLQEFDTGDFDLSEDFKEKKLALIKALLGRLSPYERKHLLEEFSSRQGDA